MNVCLIYKHFYKPDIIIYMHISYIYKRKQNRIFNKFPLRFPFSKNKTLVSKNECVNIISYRVTGYNYLTNKYKN